MLRVPRICPDILDAIADSGDTETLKQLRFLNLQSSSSLAPRLFRTIHLSDRSIISTLQDMRQNYQRVASSLRELYIIISEEDRDLSVKGKAVIRYLRRCQANVYRPDAVNRAVSALDVLQGDEFSDIQRVSLVLGTDSLMVPDVFCEIVHQAIRRRDQFHFSIQVLDTTDLSTTLFITCSGVHLQVNNLGRHLHGRTHTCFYLSGWVEFVARCITAVTIQEVDLVPEDASVLPRMSCMTTLKIENVGLVSCHSRFRITSWEELWIEGMASWSVLTDMTVLSVSYGPTKPDVMRVAKDAASLQQLHAMVAARRTTTDRR
jgi:hypothetical protein